MCSLPPTGCRMSPAKPSPEQKAEQIRFYTPPHHHHPRIGPQLGSGHWASSGSAKEHENYHGPLEYE